MIDHKSAAQSQKSMQWEELKQLYDQDFGDFQKINYSFSRIIIILGVWEVGIDGCPLLPIL
jgi:hypothetical protein